MYTPKEVAENYLSTCRVKAALPLGRMFLLACLAGAFVALAGVASTAAAATVGDPSLAKLISGCVFPAGLAMVIVAGSELFTGNNLMIMGVLSRVISARRMLRNWGVVYLGNFVGAALVAALCVLGHVFAAFDGRLAASVISIAQAKASLSFGDAFVRGILCNFLVCIAVWMASAAKSVPGKILAVFFPIMTFVVAGFEHSVADMYYLTAGLLTAAQTTRGGRGPDVGQGAAGQSPAGHARQPCRRRVSGGRERVVSLPEAGKSYSYFLDGIVNL
ncbi:MAG: formate/nitrite transporter family protein [Oscillospiraceae bacterium]